MSFRLVDTGWDKELTDAIRKDDSVVRIICPFMKINTVQSATNNVDTDSYT